MLMVLCCTQDCVDLFICLWHLAPAEMKAGCVRKVFFLCWQFVSLFQQGWIGSDSFKSSVRILRTGEPCKCDWLVCRFVQHSNCPPKPLVQRDVGSPLWPNDKTASRSASTSGRGYGKPIVTIILRIVPVLQIQITSPPFTGLAEVPAGISVSRITLRASFGSENLQRMPCRLK